MKPKRFASGFSVRVRLKDCIGRISFIPRHILYFQVVQLGQQVVKRLPQSLVNKNYIFIKSWNILLRSEIPSGMCAKLHTVAASNNSDHARNLSYYYLLALHI